MKIITYETDKDHDEKLHYEVSSLNIHFWLRVLARVFWKNFFNSNNRLKRNKNAK